MHNLLYPNQYVGNPQAKDRAFEEGIGYYGPKLGIYIQQKVILPDVRPGQTEERDADFKGIQNIGNTQDTRQYSGVRPFPDFRIWIRRLSCHSREYDLQSHSLVHLFFAQHPGNPDPC